MKLIPLSRGLFAQADDEDFEELNKYKWHAYKKPSQSDNLTYARRNTKSVKGEKRTIISMHRQIMKVTDPKTHIDHMDHNGLNCQKSNMRLCVGSENVKNTSSHRNSTSKYLGVSWDKARKRWLAVISANGKHKYIGVFVSEEDAARARDEFARKLHGEFANLNFK